MAASVYEKIVKYIDEHIKDEITLDDISKLAGYSIWHLYKIFKIYSPVPIKEFIRNKRLYAAATEIYTGRKLYDVALDYGYETPAGFYKAFQTVFGCKPSEYKINNTRRNIFMNIENVKTIEELNEGLKFFKYLYPDLDCFSQVHSESDEKFGRQWWSETFKKNPELLLYAKDGGTICAVTFAFNDGGGDGLTIHEGIIEDYWNTGIFEALFIELEKRAKKLGFTRLTLGIQEGQEEFYAKLGYTGSMLIQSEKHSVDELKKVIEGNKNYEITGTNIYEGYINQLWLRVSILDKELKKKYEEELGDCWCQIVVGKGL
jgi:AraC-like DNA-binding protein/GNAT superfamily N-acetyltransferase